MKKTTLILKIFIFLFGTFILVLTGFYTYAYITPKVDIKSANEIQMYDKDNFVFYSNIDNKNWIKLEDISKNIINSTISVEDKNFYNHQGFDYLRIIKAIFVNIKNKSLDQGASTISQQYIKNLYLDFDKTWKRKIQEAFLTFELEVHSSKDEILEGYLNTINYGAGNYGIENASKYYFNKSASDLTLAEASIIVGIPKSPAYYDPINNYKNAKNRQRIVLESMVKNNYISKNEMKKVYSEKLVFFGKNDIEKLESVNYYKDAVFEELKTIKTIPTSLLNSGGLKIYTNLDISVQEKLENAIYEEMNKDDSLQVASLVAEPQTGKIIGLIGGFDYNKSQFNRVTQASRQVGSTIKPFLYYSALENGFTPSTTFTSEASSFNLGNGKTYSPKNSNNNYANKKISMAAAIAYSDNIYAVKTHLFLGTDVLVNTTKKMGIKTHLNDNASLALGTNEIPMIDYANGFLTLANEGKKIEGFLISKITDINDNVLYEHKFKEELVLNSKITYVLNEMLSNTYNYDLVDYGSPTMLYISNLLTKKYAVKSGSTEFDSWAIGYNKDALVMVWNGYDDNTSLKVEQGLINKKIWAKSIESILFEKENNWYEIPDNIIMSLVNPISGEFEINKKNISLYYLKGTEPTINIDYLNTQ